MHSFIIRQMFKKWCWNICNRDVNLCLRENNGANNPSTLTACTQQSPSWINMGFSADQYLLFWEFTYPLRWNQVLLQSLWTSYPTWMQMQQFLFHLLCKPHKQFCCRCPQSSTNSVQLFLYTSTACSIIVQNWNCCLKFVNCFVEQLHQTTFSRIKNNVMRTRVPVRFTYKVQVTHMELAASVMCSTGTSQWET
jgi:hypothetical protein